MGGRTVWWVAGLLVLLQACASSRGVDGPMAQVHDKSPCGEPARELIVMLPGLYDRPADFVDRGFVQAVRQRQINADITLLDAHVGYYNERQIVDRLRREVIAPAQAKGYERIWLVGISLGGLGALLYSHAHPQDIAGFYALAPYLGERALLEAIEQGGLAQWQPGAPEAMGAQAWRLAQAYANGTPGLPEGHIGYGQDDRFAQANALFASALPPRHRYVIKGGHDWQTWQSLWTAFLNGAQAAQLPWRAGVCANPSSP